MDAKAEQALEALNKMMDMFDKLRWAGLIPERDFNRFGDWCTTVDMYIRERKDKDGK